MTTSASRSKSEPAGITHLPIEYKIVTTTTPTASTEQLSREYGAEGWQLITLVKWDQRWFYYFSRPAPMKLQ